MPVLGFLGSLFSGLASAFFKNTDVVKIAITGVKILVIGTVFTMIISFVNSITTKIGSIISTAFGEVNAVGSLDLGYVAGAIGADEFINALLSSLYIAISLYGSVMISIIIFKYSIIIYKTIIAV